MKRILEFKFPFYRFAGLDLCNCYASIYLFLQGVIADNTDYYCQAMTEKSCNDCWKCADSLQEKSERLNQMFGMIFDGRWTTQRDSWTGEKTKIQKELTGKYSDFDVKTMQEMDFLTGFTGYNYNKITKGLKESVISSIDASNPVIAKLKIGEIFRVIIGYDGDMLVEPDYRPADNAPDTNNPTSYDEIEYLYVFGKKIPQRYSFLDVLKAMENVMGSDFAEGIWYDIKHNVFSGNACDLSVLEVKKRFSRFYDLMDMMPNRGHSIRLPFGDKDLLKGLGVDVCKYRELVDVIENQGHLLHERGYMLMAISTCIINLSQNDADNFPWDKLGLVNAAEQIFELLIDCDMQVLLAIKKAIRQGESIKVYLDIC
ncbi:MAG: hypothetical protein FWD90_06750 [Defluviitaleaceae bacterium]|nr:hypothetical protein [Defluviitaleaceae bacterium]